MPPHISDWISIVGLILTLLTVANAAGKLAGKLEVFTSIVEKLGGIVEKLDDKVELQGREISNIQGALHDRGVNTRAPK